MLRAHVQFYIYVDNDEEYESGLYRCNELKQLGCNAFVMYNIDNKRTTRIKALQRWANRKQLFWQFDIDDYKKDTQAPEIIESLNRAAGAKATGWKARISV